MTAFAIILLFLFALILGLLISILLYRPKKAASGPEETEEEKPILPVQEKKEADHFNSGKKLLQELDVRYPCRQINMDPHLLEHGLLLCWKGKVKSGQTVVLSIVSPDCQKACMSAVQRIDEASELPQYSFDLLFPYRREYEKDACAETQDYLQKQGIHPIGILMDGSNNEYLLHQARSQALIGTSTGAYMECRVNGNPQKTQRWIEQLRPTEILPLHNTRYIKKITASLRKQIPFMIRLELRILPQKGIRDLLIMIPAAWVWMRASIEKRTDSIILRAPDQTLLEEAYKILEEDASRNAFYLVDVTHWPESSMTLESDRIYQRTASAIAVSFDVKGIVPVPVGETGTLGQWGNWKVCRYLPLTEYKKESLESAILFYHSFLTQA